MTLPNIPKVQCSNVVYLPVFDLHADSTEAMQAVVSNLHEEYGIGESGDYLVLVGDQKTFTRIHELKRTGSFCSLVTGMFSPITSQF